MAALILQPTGPGVYLDRTGATAVIETQGPDGKWHGYIPGSMTKTWWHRGGMHALYANHDICAKKEGK